MHVMKSIRDQVEQAVRTYVAAVVEIVHARVSSEARTQGLRLRLSDIQQRLVSRRQEAYGADRWTVTLTPPSVTPTSTRKETRSEIAKRAALTRKRRAAAHKAVATRRYNNSLTHF